VWIHCQELSTSAACLAYPASLTAAIVLIAKTVSNETGSDIPNFSEGFRYLSSEKV